MTSETLDIGGTAFGFTPPAVEDLESSRYTLCQIMADNSTSIRGSEKLISECIRNTVLSTFYQIGDPTDLQKDPTKLLESASADSIMLGLSHFHSEIDVQHDLRPLSVLSQNMDQYNDCVRPRGCTVLYDAIVDGAERILTMAKWLVDKDIARKDINGHLVVITDGVDQGSTRTIQAAKNSLDAVFATEGLESIKITLVGINASHCISYLEDVKDKLEIDEFIDAKDATPESMAKLQDHISQSFKATSQALGTGGKSISLAF